MRRPCHTFDLAVSLNTLHNLYLDGLYRVCGKSNGPARDIKYIVMANNRNDREKVNLLYWQLTCECFFRPRKWEFIFAQAGYTGGYGLIYFE